MATAPLHLGDKAICCVSQASDLLNGALTGAHPLRDRVAVGEAPSAPAACQCAMMFSSTFKHSLESPRAD